ncbi:GH25 family lysozyme [Candidatus Soleaferrea massiliensis]|uniref:glycoside hydrolase family 25 protein n=1 Tax=Candidatus Soleaferrea massiliensis TaxID=1470354 RepID=UPI00058FC5EF|nr:GH25 family lysozyme [Candidatus Soleaferrea massiliensis]
MKPKSFITIGLWILLLGALCTGYLFYTGILQFNHPDPEKYPVKGVDVSSYQGEIDWEVLASQDIRFAFIKATEGSGYQDPYFVSNWEQARSADVAVGAYHFFSYDSPGRQQAENFIAAVPKMEHALPPVIDVEFYGDYERNPPSKNAVVSSLQEMIDELETYYGVKPMLYATKKSYDLYISGGFPDHPIWIRDVFGFPKLSDSRDWSFWQYSNRMRLEGYDGAEPYIDMNVWNGTQDSFERFMYENRSIK